MARPVPEKKLLVNADDFGLSHAINSGILSAHLEGIVRSTSIVASGEAFGEAVRLAKACVSLGVGVHLTLVEEAAVADAAEIPTLAPYGLLPETYGALVKGVATGRIRMRDIELEFRAQIERCLTAGLEITHLDSHQHTHAFPNIFSLVLRLANQYRIRGIRIPRGTPALSQRRADRFLPKCLLCLLAHTDGLVMSRGECKATRHFAGLFESGDLKEASLLNILKNLKPGTTELVCHPGKPDLSPRYASWNLRRQVELGSLISDRVKREIENLGVQLISYRELCQDSASTAGCAA